MPLGQGEPRPPILKDDPEPGRGQPRAKAPENRIDQRHRHPILVDHRDIDRVAVHRLGQRGRRRHGALGVNQRRQPRRRIRRQHVIQSRACLGDKAVAGVISQLGGLGLDMRAGSAIGVHRGQIEMLQDVQHQDRRGALPVRRMLQQRVALVGAADRLAIAAARRRQIVQRMTPTQGLQRGDHILRHLTLIKAGTPLCGHPAQHLGLPRRAEDLPGFGHLTVQQEIPPRIACQGWRIIGPVKGHARRHRHALLGIVDGRGQNPVQPQPSPIRRQRAKRIHRPRQRHRLNAAHWHRRHLPRPQFLRRHPRRRAPRPVQGEHILRPRRFDQRKAIAADPGHLRLANPQQRSPRNRRIHRIAARLQNVDGSRHRQRMRRRAHSVRGISGRAAGHLEIAHEKFPFRARP